MLPVAIRAFSSPTKCYLLSEVRERKKRLTNEIVEAQTGKTLTFFITYGVSSVRRQDRPSLGIIGAGPACSPCAGSQSVMGCLNENFVPVSRRGGDGPKNRDIKGSNR